MNETYTKGDENELSWLVTPSSAFLPWFCETEGEFAPEPPYERKVATTSRRVRRAGSLTLAVHGVIRSFVGLSRIGKSSVLCCSLRLAVLHFRIMRPSAHFQGR
jgi:hypothetical protein